MRKRIILIISLIVLIIITSLFLSNKIFTGSVIKEDSSEKEVYTYTKAICNETNYCEDNEVKCEGNKTVSVTPITGAVVQFHPDWEDPRDEGKRERLCG